MRTTHFREGWEGLELAAPRLSLGATMVYHGATKLTPKGLEESAGVFEQLGFSPARRYVKLAGLAELTAGIMSILGVGTRLAALSVLATQAVAVKKVHGKKGFSNTQGGFEFNALLMSVAAGMLLSGPGRASAKHVWHSRKYRGLRGAFRRAAPDWKTRVFLALQ